MKPWIPPPRFLCCHPRSRSDRKGIRIDGLELISFIDRAEGRDGATGTLLAEGGERDKAGELLRYIASAVQTNTDVDPRVMQWLARSIERFFDDPKHDLEKALGLKRRRAGNPGGVSKKRLLSPGGHIAIAQEVEHIIATRGGKWENAISEVARIEKVSLTTVKSAHSKHKAAQNERAKLGYTRGDRALASKHGLVPLAKALRRKKQGA